MEILTTKYNISCTESDSIVSSTGTSKSARFVVISIAISLRALVLEDSRIVRRRALVRRTEIPGAAVLRQVKRQTRALASDHAPVGSFNSQLRRANPIDVRGAARALARAGAALRGQSNGQVEAIDEADVVEILAAVGAKSELY